MITTIRNRIVMPVPKGIALFLLTLFFSLLKLTDAAAQCGSCVTNSIVINTGLNTATGVPITPGTPMGTPVPDHDWRVSYVSTALSTAATGGGRTMCTIGGLADVLPGDGAWHAPGPLARYINCFNDDAFPGGGGPYIADFYREFTVCTTAVVTIDFDALVDNYITAIDIVNSSGTTVGSITGPGDMPQVWPGHYYAFYRHYTGTMTLPADTYKLKIRMEEDGYAVNAIGLCIEGTISSTTMGLSGAHATISGPDFACIGSGTTFTGSPSGSPTWSLTNGTGVATISSSGVVTGTTAGTVTITYSGTDACGWAMATKVITINPTPALTGHAVCAGDNFTMGTTVPGGTWAISSGSSGIATVGSSTGTVNGISAGTAVVTYTSPCGNVAYYTVTVSPTYPITGSTSLCIGVPATYTTTTGGYWNCSGATITSVGSSTFVVTPSTGGTAIITFTSTLGCPSYLTATVMPLPVITGASVCPGGTTSLSANNPGGTWNAAASPVATINSSTGLVTGGSPGTISITYTDPCGNHAYNVVTVTPGPPVTGDLDVCQGDTKTLSSTTPGTWTSSDPDIHVDPAGSYNGITPGTAIITYTSSVTSCTTQVVVTVYPQPITSPVSLCVGSTTSVFLIGGTSGIPGSWSTLDITLINIDAAGSILGLAAGTAHVTFTSTAGCWTSTTADVMDAPIIYEDHVCLGSTLTLSASESGGAWWSTYAGFDPATGVITGIGVGTAVVSYVGAHCTGVQTINIVPPPVITSETDFNVCPGLAPTILHGSPAPGTWTGSSSASYVTDLGGGVGSVTGTGPGSTILTYTDLYGCVANVVVTTHCPCAAFDESATTLTTDVGYTEGCKYGLTANTLTINGATIVGYMWNEGGTMVWHPSSATNDVETVFLAYSGTMHVEVTFYAVDTLGDTCTLTRTVDLSCEHQPCYYDSSTNMTVTSTTDSAGNCVFTATANVSTVHTIVGYEWTAPVIGTVVNHTSASTDAITFTMPSPSSGDVTVLVHIVDPYFGAGSDPCCSYTHTEHVNCGEKDTCKCFARGNTTIEATQLTLKECMDTTQTGDTIIGRTSTGTSSSAGTSAGNGGPGDIAIGGPGNTGTSSNPNVRQGCCFHITVSAGISQDCRVLAYEWHLPTGVEVHSISSTTDDVTVTIPSIGTTTIWVVIYAEDGEGRRCEITKSIELTCGCECFNDSTTLIHHTAIASSICTGAATSQGIVISTGGGDDDAAGGPGLNVNCCYSVTATAGLTAGCTVFAYIWELDGVVFATTTTSALFDHQNVTVGAGGTSVVKVTIIAVDSAGRPCTTVLTDTLTCDCSCLNDATTKLTYEQVDTKLCFQVTGPGNPQESPFGDPGNGNDNPSPISLGCCYKVTATAGLMNNCHVVSYVWNINGITTTIPTSATSYSQFIHVATSTATTITVTINAATADGKMCSEVRTITLDCGCHCFKPEGVTITYALSPTQPRKGCLYYVTADAGVIEPCKVVSYTWSENGGTPTVYTTSLPAYTLMVWVPEGTTKTVNVTVTAIDEKGKLCTFTATRVLDCTKDGAPCCLDKPRCTLSYLSSMDPAGNCLFDFTATPAFIPGVECRFLGFIWQRLGYAPSPLTTSNTYHVAVAPGTTATVYVTFLALTPSGDTCTVTDTLTTPKCKSRFGRESGAGEGKGDGTGGEVITNGITSMTVFPNPTENTITISSPEVDINSIQVIDINGKKVGNYTYNQVKKATISLEKLANGTYLIRINNEVSKVVVKSK